MEDKKLRPYADITVSTGKYMKDGKERNRYQKIGTLFATPHFSHMTIKLDALPIGDCWLSVFPRDEKQANQSGNIDIPEENIDKELEAFAAGDLPY